MRKKEFVKCGFEFTAAKKHRGKLKVDYLESNGDSVSRRYYYERLNTGFKWINRRFSSDDCGIEISTPIVKTAEEVANYFNDFNKFVSNVNMTLDINEATCGLGGCHIHLNTSNIPITKRKYFLRNLVALITNYPQLNWGFNDVNDNINANSLLDDTPFKNRNTNIHNVMPSLIGWNDDCYWDDEIPPDSPIYKFRDDKVPYNAFYFNPLKTEVIKKFALKYHMETKTIELRFFDMPTSLRQHILHHDVAKALFNYCLDKTNKGQIIRCKYKSIEEINNLPLKTSIEEFKSIMKKLKIDTSRTNKMIKNIRTRYQWQKSAKVFLR